MGETADLSVRATTTLLSKGLSQSATLTIKFIDLTFF